METAAPKGGDADGDRKTTGPCNSIPRAAAAQVATPDLPALRDRLLEARRRLDGGVALNRVERFADLDRFPPAVLNAIGADCWPPVLFLVVEST